jgi:Macrocin-O-methyltransferase (TylF)
MISSLVNRAFQLSAAAPVDGSIVEFGVYKGSGSLTMAKLAKRYFGTVPAMFGFDSFEGMPPTSTPLEHALASEWAEGTFADTSLESVQARLTEAGVAITLVKSVFSDLRPLAEYGVTRVRIAHIDADVYEGYRDALRLLTPHVGVGTVMLFDESIPPSDYRYQGVRLHGKRAVEEWERSTGANLHLVRFGWTVGLHVIVDEDYLRRYHSILERVRRDSPRESLVNLLQGIAR